MKISEIRAMDLNEAREKAVELKADLAKELSIVASGTRPEKPGRIRQIRRMIARILTVINEKEGGIDSKRKAVKKIKRGE